MKRGILGMSAALALLGCPSDDTDDTGTASDTAGGSTSTTSATAESTTEPGTSSSGDTQEGSGSATTGSESSADTSGSDTGVVECLDDPAPDEGPSIVTIDIELTNDTEEPVFVLDVDSSKEPFSGCAPFEIERDDLELPTLTSSRCGCECPGAGPQSFSTVALEPGATQVFSWDGRVLTPFIVREACLDGSGGCGTDQSGVPAPLEAGPVTIRIGLYEEVGSFDGSGTFDFAALCEAPSSFTVDVELGEDDQTIPVAVSSL